MFLLFRSPFVHIIPLNIIFFDAPPCTRVILACVHCFNLLSLASFFQVYLLGKIQGANRTAAKPVTGITKCLFSTWMHDSKYSHRKLGSIYQCMVQWAALRGAARDPVQSWVSWCFHMQYNVLLCQRLRKLAPMLLSLRLPVWMVILP